MGKITVLRARSFGAKAPQDDALDREAPLITEKEDLDLK